MGKIIAENDRVLLRDTIPSDVDAYIYWMNHGEWLEFDAPWESVSGTVAELKQRFNDRFTKELLHPRICVFIATRDNRPIGWVSRYREDRSPDTWMVGIDICEDDMLNKGLGTEALGLWVDYLFTNSTVHRIGLDTWSFNTRMSHVAEKLGFVPEGVQREVLRWDGKWLDFTHFGMLRTEWEAIRMMR